MDEFKVRRRQVGKVLGVSADFCDETLRDSAETPENLVEEVVRGDGGDVPPQPAQQQQLPRQHLLVGDGVVRVEDELVGGQRLRLLEFGSDEHGDGGDELEMLLLDGDLGQEPVEVVDGQREHVVFALLLFANLYWIGGRKRISIVYYDGKIFRADLLNI